MQDRKLVVCEQSAGKVDTNFEHYLALGSVLAVQDELASQGIRSRSRISQNSEAYGNAAFSRGALYLTLKNRI